MTEMHPSFSRPRIPGTWGSLLVLTGFVLIGMAIGNLLAVLMVMALWGNDPFLSMENLSGFLENPALSTNGWNAMLLLQAIGHLFTFLVPALLYWRFIEKRGLRDFDFQKTGFLRIALPVLLLTIGIMPFTAVVAEWNESMVLPEGLRSVEQWMKASEVNLERLTRFMLAFDSPFQLLVAILVIALIPAIGEELLFRGILQRKLAERWANVHLSIWVSAILFSAIHFQFYGFLPRLLLGALFGYLYFWTGRLNTAIFAHFVNNAFTVLMVWLYKQNKISINIEHTQDVSGWVALLSVMISLGLLILLYQRQYPRRISGHSFTGKLQGKP